MSCLKHVALLVAVISSLAHAQEGRTWQRQRRQFPGSEWVPLTKPCPTCRPLADPSDSKAHFDDIGLVPPRPPPTTRQVHGTGNFFPQNSGLLQGAFPQRQPFQEFLQFNQPNVVQFPQQQPFFTQQQQQSFLPQTYLNNPQLLLNENPQLLPLVNNPQVLLGQQKQQSQQQIQATNSIKDNNQIRFRPEAPKPELKSPQNVQLEQEKANTPATRLELPLNAPPAHFINNIPGHFQQQQRFPQFPQLASEQQPLLQVNPNDPFLTPPPFGNNATDIVIPGLEKEEIQLLYVPVETLRQRGHLQGHTIDEVNSPFQQFQQFQQPPSGHLITQSPIPPPTQFTSSPSVTPPPVLTQNLPLRDLPHQFATEKPAVPITTEQVVTIQPRPVSTLRQFEALQQTPSPSIKSTEQQRTTVPDRSTNHFSLDERPSKVTDTFSNEVTPPFSSNNRPTSAPERHLQQFQFKSQPVIETATEITLPTTTLQPHQPPLSVYVGSELGDVKVIDVLRALKDAATIPVIDSFTSNNPKVFVGPANLNPPPGYGKFELPYLSNLDTNRIEQRHNLPFFVAPLNFNPPHGYSKIPFPSPHVGSVVVSTETEMRPAELFERGTTSEPVLPDQTHNERNEATTLPPETNTNTRTWGRRPNQFQRPSGRKPAANARQRVTPRPQAEETTFPVHENQVSTQDFLREPQEDRKRVQHTRRQRLRTTTEAIAETVVTEAPTPQEILEPQGPVVELKPQLVDLDQPQVPIQYLQQPILPPADFHQQQKLVPQLQQSTDFIHPPPPPPPVDLRSVNRPTQFNQNLRQTPPPTFQQPPFIQSQVFEQFHPTQEEIQSLFEVPPPQPPQPQPDSPVIENTGNSGFQQLANQELNHQFISTEPPNTSTRFLENQSPSSSPIEPTFETEATQKYTASTSTTTEKLLEVEPQVEEIEKEIEAQREIPKKISRFSQTNVPAVQTHSAQTKLRSPIRSRVRGNPPFTTSTTNTATAAGEEDEPSHIEVSATAEDATSPAPESMRTTSKYLSHFNRSRKPLRPTTSRAETTTTSPTRSYTVRPLRRSTLRTSVATKRIRKPTTSAPYNEEDENADEPTFAKKSQLNFAPSAASNEINDDQPHSSVPKPKVRKPYFHRDKTSSTTEDASFTSPSPSTTTYQERKDSSQNEEARTHEESEWGSSDPERNVSDLHLTTQPPSGPSGPSASDDIEPKKHLFEEKKKALDPESNKKGRRRLRVRVQKRPHDNFETAESQNHGTVANALIPPTPAKPNAPDPYRFSQGDFDFENSGKFIGTQLKGHVRNITTDILENTSTFSSPGTDSEVHRVTIATESTTITPDTINAHTNESQTEKSMKDHNEDISSKNDTIDATTQRHETTKASTEFDTTQTELIETTTEIKTEPTTIALEVASSTSSPVVTHEARQRKVLKTSTTTQVSHETEICYKGKCIKTNSDNPDLALKQLVESANSEVIESST